MKDFAVTFSVIFGFFFLFYLMLPNFKYMKSLIITFQLIISFILLSKNFYKKHSLYKDPKFEYIQNINFYPIKSIYKTYDENGDFNNIGFITMNSNKFSLIKTQKYSIQCLEHYFILANESCPITDIKLEEEKKSENEYENYSYIQISNNEYLYYTNNNQLGKLYKSFNYSEFKENKEDIFTIEEIVRKEYNKLKNPIIDFKFFIQFFDKICASLISISFVYSFFESSNDRKLGWFRVFNIIIQLIILLIYIIRNIKFIKVKDFLSDNEDIYEDESYKPNKYFNIDGFPLSLPITLIFFNILYVIFPNKKSFINKKIPEIVFSSTIWYLVVFYIPFLVSIITIEILDYYNDLKVKKAYDNLIYNWELNPLKSIELISNQQSGYDFKWRIAFFKIERLNDLNYIDIYQNENGKICGKDNYGNNLYFPEDLECPINNIFISDSNEDLPDYTKLKIDDIYYLYYTNSYIEGKIVVDLRINSNDEIPLNPDGNSLLNYYSMPFYEEIDFNDEYLYSINYLGINTSSISDRSKIKNFPKRIKAYKGLYYTKSILINLYYTVLLISIILLFFNNSPISCNLPDCKEVFVVFFVLTKLVNIVIIIICLSFHVKYIKNYMNKINIDFEKDKNDFKWNVAVLIFWLISGVYIAPGSNGEKKFDLYDETQEKIVQEPQNESDKNKNKEEIDQNIIKFLQNINNTSSTRITNQNSKNEGNGEQIAVIFQSQDQSIHTPIICRENQKFSEVEKKLYDEYPEYKNTENIFLCNGDVVDKSKTIKENKIKNGNIIVVTIR